MPGFKTWLFRPLPSPEEALALAKELRIHPLLATFLVQRGICDPLQGERFLSPSLEDLQSPWMFQDMDVAAKRVSNAVFSKEPIGVFGDYDVDGICATVILSDYLSKIGLKVFYKSPDRQKEGYGLSIEGLKKLKERGIRLVVACDCGSRDHKALSYAKEAGLEVIVLDHHEPPEALPPALALINPKRKDCPSFQKGPCSTAVVFYFLKALGESLGRSPSHLPSLNGYLELVALATLADRVPLVNDNRVFAKLGLQRLVNSEWVGLKELKRLGLGDPFAPVSEKDANFVIIPRLNASGRMATARNTVRLLLSRTPKEARELAAEIEILNADRRRLQNGVLEEAMEQALPWVEQSAPAIVVWGRGWHHGVAGIVAAKLVERFHRPAIVLERLEDGTLKGSGRSVPGISLLEGLEHAKDHLERFGGHKAACGLSLHDSQLPRFLETFMSGLASRRKVSGDGMVPLLIDVTLKRALSEEDWLGILGPLSPFGEANPYPRVLLQSVSLNQTQQKRNGSVVLILNDGTELCLQGKWAETDEPAHLGNAVLEARLVKKRRISGVEWILNDFRPSLEMEYPPSA